jgi:cathepsin L
VTPVKNQGDLKADWAFSVTGAVEGRQDIVAGQLESLSEQELVDCAGTGTQECQGGSPVQGFILAEQKGLCTEQSYPYTATHGTCKQCSVVARPKGHTIVCGGEAGLAAALNQGPVSAVVSSDWMPGFVGAGVVDAECNTFAPHTYTAVLVVGYTATYWIVKNSLGTQWGSNGYFKLIRGKNACGIANFAAYPTF